MSLLAFKLEIDVNFVGVFMKFLFRLLPLFLVALSFSNLNSLSANSSGDGDCSKYEAVFLRGSGQNLEDGDFRAFKSALSEKINSSDLEISELDYPAISVADFSTALSTFLSAGESYKFKNSVETGIENLKNYISSESKKCPEKKFILAGYSQGAMVISKTLPNLNAEKILYAGTFGDPKLYLPEGKNGRACKNIGLSNYRVYVPDCDTDEGVLTALNPYQQPDYIDKLGAFCNMYDFMCGSDLNLFNPLGAHLSYNSANGYEKFAEIILEKISSKNSDSSKTKAIYSETGSKDIAVLFDFKQFGLSVSGLRNYSISDELKSKLVELGKKGARIAFYNVCSVLDKAEPLELVSNFTTNEIEKAVDKMNLMNQDFSRYNFASGSDNVYYALSKISNEASWREKAEKNIYLITNVYHDSSRTSFDGTDYEKALNTMREKNVKLSLISEKGEEMNYVNKTLVSGTGGALVGSDMSKIRYLGGKANYNLESKIISKKYELEAENTLVIVNDVVYGITSNREITIFGLSNTTENSIILIGFDASGKRVSKKVYNYQPDFVGVPDCSFI